MSHCPNNPRLLGVREHSWLFLSLLPFVTVETGTQEGLEASEGLSRMLGPMQGGCFLEKNRGGLGEVPCPQNLPCELPLESLSFLVWKMELFSTNDH